MNDFQITAKNIITGSFLLGLSILLSYWQILGNGFLDYDDAKYVISNDMVRAGLNPESIRWALTATYDGNWFPLTWLSHMTDITLFGSNPTGHHASNLLLHTLNAVLLFTLLLRLTGFFSRSLMVALLFALHPLHVESVAWIAERKDLLSTLFFFLTISAYLAWQEKGKTWQYAAMILLYACGLASKPMLVSLPFVLLLLDFWPLSRLPDNVPLLESIKKPLIEKTPLFLLSAASCVLTVQVQRTGGGLNETNASTLPENISNALTSYSAYILKMFWPEGLAVMYPFPMKPLWWQSSVSLLFLCGITVLLLFKTRKHPWLVTGWFWYLITLLPVIGIIRVGVHAYADRYTYIPLTGLFVITVWAAAECSSATGVRPAALTVVSVLVCLILGTLTWRQTRYWESSYTLFARTLEVTRNNYLAHNNYATELIKRGKLQEAMWNLKQALRVKPEYGAAYYNMGVLFNNLNDVDGAIMAFNNAVRFGPVDGVFGQLDIQAMYQLGKSYAMAGNTAEAKRAARALAEVDREWAARLETYIKSGPGSVID